MPTRIYRRLKKEIYLYNIKRNNNIVGKGCKFGYNSYIYGTKWGNYSGCNINCNIVACLIGNYVNIAPNVLIGQRNHIWTNFTTHDFVYEGKDYLYVPGKDFLIFDKYLNKIGHDVWIGANAVIQSGCEIGNGAIVAGGSVVTKSVPAYAIVGGNPAKILKYRFSQEQIEILEASKWFEMELEQVLEKKQQLSAAVNFDFEAFKSKNWYTKKSEMQ